MGSVASLRRLTVPSAQCARGHRSERSCCCHAHWEARRQKVFRRTLACGLQRSPPAGPAPSLCYMYAKC